MCTWPKLVPEMVMELCPCVGAVAGETLLMLGARYEKPAFNEPVCPDTVMATARPVPMPGGDRHVADVCVRPGETMLQGNPPMVIVPVSPKFKPLNVTVVRPLVKSVFGLIDVITGLA